MQAGLLTFEHSLARRLLAWAQERFPLPNAIGSAVIFACALVVGRAMRAEGALVFGPLDVVAAFAGVSFFLLLRVFDEHKDFAEDVRNYPERVLSRGLITLDHLKVVGAVCVALQLGTALAADRGIGRVTGAWALTLIYALLMLREFFCAEWLKPRLGLYAATHMVVSPLATLWFCVEGAREARLSIPLVSLAAISYATAAAFEVTRKSRGPEEERFAVDSYTKQLGVRGAALAMLLSLGAALVAGVFLLRQVAPEQTGALVVTVLAFAPVTASVLSFVRNPSAKARKRNEGLAALALIACHVGPIYAVLAERGIVWLS